MNCLVVHHIYADGMAADLSGYRNHGLPFAVKTSASPFAPSFTYATGDSRVTVEPSESLQDLLAVRAVVTFYLDPAGGLSRRYNLIEGHLCFALFVNPDGSLMGTILDADGNWLGAQSPRNTVSTARWHQAELRHDGINQCSVLLDGLPVATSYSATGPVRSVGPHGIAVGHWPETSGQYTFDGHIRETWVYKYDPAKAAKGLIDPCCGGYRKALDAMADDLRGKGMTREEIRAQGMALVKFGLSLSAQVRGTDEAKSQQHATLSAQALSAFRAGNSSAYTSALAQLAAMSSTALSGPQQQQIESELEALVKALPLPIKTFQNLIGEMCLGGAKVDPKSILQAVSDAVGAASHKRTSTR
jgi:hypothetical protein